MKNFLIGISIALGIISAVVAALMNTKVYPTKPDGGTPSLERALHDAGFGSYGPL